MTKYTPDQIREARLAQALFDLAEDYKKDSNLMAHLSVICFRIKELQGQPKDKRESVDWELISDYFDKLEYGSRDYNSSDPGLDVVTSYIQKVLFEEKAQEHSF